MIPPLVSDGRGSVTHRLPLIAVVVVASLIAACQRVPLLAPSGSIITLTSSATALPLGGTTSIIAQVIEASGAPPHSGTQVTFTTNLGSVQPANPETDINGQVVVTFSAGTQSGTATINAISGGASVGADGAVRIAIGAAAVGRVVVGANPATVSQLGGSTTITATVVDLNGNVLPSAPVNFTTTAGTFSSSFVNTDQNGNAQTRLTTSQQATVTASVGAPGTVGTGTGTGTGTGGTTTSGQTSGSVTVAVTAAPTLTITPPSTAPSAGVSALYTFTVTVPANTGVAVRDVTVNWGDGQTRDLGALTGTQTVAHSYNSAGTYDIVATLTDALGNSFNVSTAVVVNSRLVPTVSLTTNTTSPTVGTVVTFTASITPAANSGAVIDNVTVNFDTTGVDPATTSYYPLGAVSGTGITLQHVYQQIGTYTVKLTADDSNGGTASATTIVAIQQTPIVSLTVVSSTPNGSNTDVVLRATVTPSTLSVAQYVWAFGDGISTTTTTNNASHSYVTTSLPKTATVTIYTTTGQTATSSTTVQ